MLALIGESEEDIVLDYQMSFSSGKAMTDEKATPQLLTGRIYAIVDYLKSLDATETAKATCKKVAKYISKTFKSRKLK